MEAGATYFLQNRLSACYTAVIACAPFTHAFISRILYLLSSISTIIKVPVSDTAATAESVMNVKPWLQRASERARGSKSTLENKQELHHECIMHRKHDGSATTRRGSRFSMTT